MYSGCDHKHSYYDGGSLIVFTDGDLTERICKYCGYTEELIPDGGSWFKWQEKTTDPDFLEAVRIIVENR